MAKSNTKDKEVEFLERSRLQVNNDEERKRGKRGRLRSAVIMLNLISGNHA